MKSGRLLHSTIFFSLIIVTNGAATKAEYACGDEPSPWQDIVSFHQHQPAREIIHNVVQHEKTYDTLPADPIDVVFICHPKDSRTLDLAINGARLNVENIRRVIVVSATRLTNNAEWFDEAAFPFNKASVSLEIFNGNKTLANNYLMVKDTRIGWIYQQFLKLYAPFVIPGISSNVLTIDADTIFLNSVSFIDEAGKALFNPGKEFVPCYFAHAARLLPGFKKLYAAYSGISHHMLFQRAILEDLFSMIQSVHKTEPWRAFCRCIDLNEIFGSAFSEYEIYFNFVFARTEQVKIRLLRWNNIKFDQKKIDYHAKNGFDYVSCHTYILKAQNWGNHDYA